MSSLRETWNIALGDFRRPDGLQRLRLTKKKNTLMCPVLGLLGAGRSCSLKVVTETILSQIGANDELETLFCIVR